MLLLFKLTRNEDNSLGLLENAQPFTALLVTILHTSFKKILIVINIIKW